MAAARLQMDDVACLRYELWACQKALDAERERSKALEKNLETASDAMNAENELSA